MTFRFGSVCSGIEAASVAWHPLGWQAAWLAEIEPFPSAVLAHHYPDVPNLGDMTTIADRIRAGLVEAPDMLCGGTPCQAFSVAGQRRSLSDERGNLSLVFCELADAIDDQRFFDGLEPCIVFWENVPGCLNTNDNAFGCILGELAGEDCALEPPGGKWADAGAVFGPKRAIAWRVLDAQYFGVAQRRRRVFLVASARKGFDPAAVLFEFHGVRRDSAPSREAGEGSANGVAEGAGVRRWPADVASTLNAAFGDKQGLEDQHALSGAPLFVPATANAITASMANSCLGHNKDENVLAFDAYNQLPTGDVSKTVASRTDQDTASLIAFDTTQITSPGNYSSPKPGDPCHPLAAGADAPTIAFHHNAQACQLPGEGRDTSVSDALTCSQQAAVAYPTLAFKSGQSEAAGGVFVTEEYAPTLQAQNNGSTAVPSVAYAVCATGDRTHALTTRSAAEEDGTGRGVPITPASKAHVQVCPTLRAGGNSTGGDRPPGTDVDTADSLLTVSAPLFCHRCGEYDVTDGVCDWCGRTDMVSANNPNMAIAIRTAQTGSNGWGINTDGTAYTLDSAQQAVATCVTGDVFHTLRAEGFDASEDGTGRGAGAVAVGIFQDSEFGVQQYDTAGTLRAGRIPEHQMAMQPPSMAVRRLTPRECERLQGFPDDYTAIPWKRKPASDCPDGPRYKALGNSWAVPCVRWIGRRIVAELHKDDDL